MRYCRNSDIDVRAAQQQYDADQLSLEDLNIVRVRNGFLPLVNLVLEFGWNPGLPPTATAAWGARAILRATDPYLNFVPNRQGGVGNREERQQIATALNAGIFDEIHDEIARLYSLGQLRGDQAQDHLLYWSTDTNIAVIGNTNASGGYLYLVVFFAPSDWEPPTLPTLKCDNCSGELDPDDFTVCNYCNKHLCIDCFNICLSCNYTTCKQHGKLPKCANCEEDLCFNEDCENRIYRCEECGNRLCSDCTDDCPCLEDSSSEEESSEEESRYRYNPWRGKADVERHNKKCAKYAACRKLWLRVANDYYNRTGDDGQAVIRANTEAKKWLQRHGKYRRNADVDLQRLRQRWAENHDYEALCQLNHTLLREGQEPAYSVSPREFGQLFEERFGNWETSLVTLSQVRGFRPTEELLSGAEQMHALVASRNILYKHSERGLIIHPLGDYKAAADSLHGIYQDAAQYALCLGWTSVISLTSLEESFSRSKQSIIERWVQWHGIDRLFFSKQTIDKHFKLENLQRKYKDEGGLSEEDIEESKEAHKALLEVFDHARFDQKLYFLPYRVLRPSGAGIRKIGRRQLLADAPQRNETFLHAIFVYDEKNDSPYITWYWHQQTGGLGAGHYMYDYEEAKEDYLRRVLGIRTPSITW